MRPFKAKKVQGVAGEAAFTLMQGLADLLIKKGAVSADEWFGVVKAAAIHHKTAPKMTEEQRLAAGMLAAYALALGPEEDMGKG